MMSYVMEYAVAAPFIYILVGFVLLGAATVLGTSDAVKARVARASASATALIGLAGAWWIA